MTDAYIIDACRTPRGIGKPGKGALSEIHPQQLGATVLKARLRLTILSGAQAHSAARSPAIWVAWRRLMPVMMCAPAP